MEYLYNCIVGSFATYVMELCMLFVLICIHVSLLHFLFYRFLTLYTAHKCVKPEFSNVQYLHFCPQATFLSDAFVDVYKHHINILNIHMFPTMHTFLHTLVRCFQVRANHPRERRRIHGAVQTNILQFLHDTWEMCP